MLQILRLFIGIILMQYSILNAQELITYSVPGGFKYSSHNDDYKVQVRSSDGDWRDLFEYEVEVDMDTHSKASMVFFDFSGTVEVRVQKNNGEIYNAAIRPASAGIKGEVDTHSLQFYLNKPVKLSIEFNGDRLHNLHLFANSIDPIKPDRSDPNLMYFGPGIHKPNDQPGDVYNIKSGTTVYVDGGAIIQGKFLVSRAKNVKIIGRGIIMHPERGVEVRHSENVEIDGLTFINPKHYTIYGGESKGLSISNIKSFSSQGWTDGIDLMSCSDVKITDVFLRNSDDCIAIYAHRWDFYGNARNYEITNSILWADVAHPTNIGTHGNVGHSGDTIENIHFKNLDILEHDEDDPVYQGCLAIMGSDKNWIRNIVYEDIRVESVQEGKLFNFQVVLNEDYSQAPGRSIENLTLKNISYTGYQNLNPSIIKGFNSSAKINSITLDHIKIHDKVLRELSTDWVEVGPFTSAITIKK